MAPPEPNADSSNTETLHDSNHKKRRKMGDHTTDQTSFNHIPWRSQSEQQIYSTKLLRALRHVLRRSPSPATKPRQVRDAANRALAATAKGRTRWSRAILSSPSSNLGRHHKKVKKAASASAVTGLKRPRSGGERRRLPAVQRKARVLSRLVPGCRKLSFPNLLEEATDYISALEMQVRTMTALAELLTGGASSSPDGPAGESMS